MSAKDSPIDKIDSLISYKTSLYNDYTKKLDNIFFAFIDSVAKSDIISSDMINMFDELLEKQQNLYESTINYCVTARNSLTGSSCSNRSKVVRAEVSDIDNKIARICVQHTDNQNQKATLISSIKQRYRKRMDDAYYRSGISDADEVISVSISEMMTNPSACHFFRAPIQLVNDQKNHQMY